MLKKINLKNKVALVTGAGKGLGKACSIALAEAGAKVSIEQRRDIRLATTHAVEASIKTVDAMYTLGGGSAVYADSPLQRHFRDVHMTSQHIMVAPSTLETVGRIYLGVEARTATL